MPSAPVSNRVGSQARSWRPGCTWECSEERLIHAPNESMDLAEMAAMALTEALFVHRCAAIGG
jgi:hypothetical protein